MTRGVAPTRRITSETISRILRQHWRRENNDVCSLLSDKGVFDNEAQNLRKNYSSRSSKLVFMELIVEDLHNCNFGKTFKGPLIDL